MRWSLPLLALALVVPARAAPQAVAIFPVPPQDGVDALAVDDALARGAAASGVELVDAAALDATILRLSGEGLACTVDDDACVAKIGLYAGATRTLLARAHDDVLVIVVLENASATVIARKTVPLAALGADAGRAELERLVTAALAPDLAAVPRTVTPPAATREPTTTTTEPAPTTTTVAPEPAPARADEGSASSLLLATGGAALVAGLVIGVVGAGAASALFFVTVDDMLPAATRRIGYVGNVAMTAVAGVGVVVLALGGVVTTLGFIE